MEFPIILFRNDPAETPVAQCRQVGYGPFLPTGWAIHEHYGSLGINKNRPDFYAGRWGNPFKTKDEARAAWDARIRELEQEGWKYKFQLAKDRNTGELVPKLIF